MHELKKVCEICLIGKSLRVSLPLFWIRTCPQDIFKTIKGTNMALMRRLNIRLVIFVDDILLMGRRLEEILMSRDTLIFLLQHLGFVLNLKKISSENRYPHHDFGTNGGKDGKVNFKMSESPFSHSNHCFGIKKIDSSDGLNCPGSSASSSTAKVFATTTNTITKPGLFIPDRDSIKQFVKTGTSLVSGKFKIKQLKITIVK